ncbi:MAG: hypothetical protein WAS73_13075 [Defluviicoccus sp.]
MIDDSFTKAAKASDFTASARAYDAAEPGARAGTKAAQALADGVPVGRRSAEALFHVVAERHAAEHRSKQAALAAFERAYPKSAAAWRKTRGL